MKLNWNLTRHRITSDQFQLLREASQSESSLNNIVHSRSRVSLYSPLAVPEAPREINLLKGQVDRSDSWYVL